jgi:zinc transporter 7
LLANIRAGGVLNLAADSLHNFTDGIAIGAAYASGENLGLSTGLAVLAHELPHEIGDFAILVQNGCTPAQAIVLQFCTAIFAFLGTFVGLFSAHYEDMEMTLLAFVSGGFVYLATMTVLPEVMDSAGNGRALFQLAVEVVAFSTGVGMMVAVAKLEDQGHHAH